MAVVDFRRRCWCGAWVGGKRRRRSRQHNLWEGKGKEVAVDNRTEGRRLIEVDEGDGDGFGMEVVILGAGWMSCDLAFFVFERLRRRVTPTGISM